MNLYFLNAKLYQKNQNVTGDLVSELPAFLYDSVSYLLSPEAVPKTNLPFSLVSLGRGCSRLRYPARRMPHHFICFLGCGGAGEALFGSASHSCAPCHSPNCQTRTRQLSFEIYSHALHRPLRLSTLVEQCCISKLK